MRWIIVVRYLLDIDVRSLSAFCKTLCFKWLELAPPNVLHFEGRRVAFAVATMMGFPFYYYVWHDLFPQPYENLWLRLFGALIMVPIAFSAMWPVKLKRYMPLYWHLVLIFSLPFFFSFMLLKNGISTVWIESNLVAVFIMVLLLDWVVMIVEWVLGLVIAYLVFSITSDVPLNHGDIWIHVPIILFAVVMGNISSYTTEMVRAEQERVLALASSIAHELRTPLLGIRSGAAGLKNYLPTLIKGYELASEARLPVDHIRKVHLDSMKGVLMRIDSETQYSNAIINVLVNNIRSSAAVSEDWDVQSMELCTRSALGRYPFADDEESCVQIEIEQDFYFFGSKLMMEHVFFNLIKNSLRHIHSAGKGNIRIYISSGSTFNKLTFRDTGSGIEPDVLPHIFKRFYSGDGKDGTLRTGLGLAFCNDVIKSFGGSITCQSARGEFTEFVLTFPKVMA